MNSLLDKNKDGIAKAVPFTLCKNEKMKSWIGYLLLVCAAIAVGFFYRIETPRKMLAVVVLLLVVTLVSGVLVCRKNRGMALFFLLIFAFIVKAEYIIYTPTWLRQHDVIGFEAGFGQAGYIEYFAEKIRLIDFDPRSLWGFFQPPLHHMIAGVWLRGWHTLGNIIGISYAQCCEAVQCLTLIYSMLITVVGNRILKLFKISGKALFVGTAFIALNPLFIQMSGSINNDILCTLLQLVSMYFFLKWMNENKLKQLVVSGLFLGLSMMTKLSGILIAPAMGIIMLIKLIEVIREKKGAESIRNLLGSYALFGAVSIPLGCFFPVRNLVLFGVPLNYTPKVGEPLNQVTMFQRFFDFSGMANPFTNMVSNGNSYDEYNIFTAILKTSIFGEADFKDTSRFSTTCGFLLLLFGIILAIILTVLFVKMLVNNIRIGFKGDKSMHQLFMLVAAATAVLFLINLCISIPNFSSQDFRYIAHVIVIEAFLLSDAMMEQDSLKKRLLAVCTGAFLILSVCMYLLAGLTIWN